ncbi:UrcA family protein [Novosphingobium album (ex Liu et al. 2023)]|uniref:UrcA family protein n=1 Tax=Novosphingobium album (ex Liu et al. 2023) TaxID=3031130 RepID=A0ABT5WM98_9SPHN|nr:UrcA family protein [Novosphingobium album (ex Liu et al. 2023)]MDE8651169.1 UrcA family protein [Novosphingobium album (ex Liu et al. 2023)]
MTRFAGRLGAALLIAVAASAAGAQPVDGSDETTSSEITVEAPRAVPAPAERSPYSGAPIVTTTVRIQVLYGDLDLAKPEDGQRLMTRIERVAHDACAQLDRLYPFSSDANCVGAAVAKSTPTAKALIAAASAK